MSRVTPLPADRRPGGHPRATDAISAARGADAPRIARLIREAKAEAMPWLAVPHSLAEDEVWVAGVLLHHHDVRVIRRREDPDGIVAVLALRPGWVDQLYVAPAEQGRGLGTLLVRTAQREATGPLHLWTFQRNRRARAFYERNGFIATRRTDGDNEEHEPDVLYRWTPPGQVSAEE